MGVYWQVVDDTRIWLIDLHAREDLPRGLRAKVGQALDRYAAGIVPSPKMIGEIWKETRPRGPCNRIEGDGCCEWVRRYGAGFQIRIEPVGERARCAFPDKFPDCPGYEELTR